MNWLWMIVRFIVFYFLQSEGNKMVQRTKAKGALVYLKTLNKVRKSLLAALVIVFGFQLVVFSFFSMITIGLWLLPWEIETKLWIGFGLASFTFVIPCAICIYLFQEKLWFKVSQAEQMIDKIDEAA